MGTALLLRQVRAAKGLQGMLHSKCAQPRPNSRHIRVPLQHKVRLKLAMPWEHKSGMLHQASAPGWVQGLGSGFLKHCRKPLMQNARQELLLGNLALVLGLLDSKSQPPASTPGRSVCCSSQPPYNSPLLYHRADSKVGLY